MELLREFLIPKCFNVWGYLAAILYLFIGVTFTGITAHLRSNERESFRCKVDGKTVRQRFVEAECFTKYQRTFNSPMPLYGFVVMTFGAVLVVCAIYSFCIKSRVEEIESYAIANEEVCLMVLEQDADQEVNQETREETCYIFYSYIIHLIARFLLGVFFITLQYKAFYPFGFQSDFVCTLRPTHSRIATRTADMFNFTSIDCHNSLGSEKSFWATGVSAVNIFFALLALGEFIYLGRRIWCTRHGLRFARDIEFCQVYLLRKKPRRNPTRTPTYTKYTTLNIVEIYKKQILDDTIQPCTRYSEALDDINVNLVIVREQTNNTSTHFIEQVQAVGSEADFVCVKNSKDLFLPNRDTAGNKPRTILVLANKRARRIALSCKIVQDWAKGDDEFYADKFVVLLKAEWFGSAKYKHTTLKESLRRATQLDSGHFDEVFKLLSEQPQKLILIVDGLEEFCATSRDFDAEEIAANDVNETVPAFSLFLKLLSGKFFREATILATSSESAPQDDYTLLRLKFDRAAKLFNEPLINLRQ